ncbi:MAG: CHAP domain-containing protein [Candidatus Saccharimonadales bacterium]
MTRNTTTLVSESSFAAKASAVAAAFLILIATPIALTAQPASADAYDDRIRALQAEIDQYQSKVGELRGQADSLQGELNRLANEKAVIQRQIDLSQAKYDQLVADIKANEEKLAKTQDALGDIVASLYADDNISSLELFASSNNISDFVDKQEYRTTVQKQLATTISEVKRLKKKLEEQKVAAQREIETGKNAREALAAKEAEQQAILDQTKGEEAAYSGLVSDREQQKLKAQQAQQAAIQAAMRRGGGGGSLSAVGSLGSYESWAGNCYVDANAWSHGGARGNGEDPLGYGCNQCVSYTAWMMAQKTGYAPSYWGNANMWPAKARANNFTVSTVPRGNSLGVIMAGTYGHIVYVNSYNPGAGTVSISQYNEYLPGKGWGYYSERPNAAAGTYDYYIYL